MEDPLPFTVSPTPPSFQAVGHPQPITLYLSPHPQPIIPYIVNQSQPSNNLEQDTSTQHILKKLTKATVG